MILTKIAILKDNYIWILYNKDNYCIIIDPGESENIIKKIEEKKWHLVSILITHCHSDHTNGINNILKKYPDIIIYGPYEAKKNGVNKIVKNNDVIFLLNTKFFIFSTPGHTKEHVSYYCPPYIFCGDVIFSAGCGRVENMQYQEMYNSIMKISNLPNDTFLCCSHEYTLSNLKFAIKILPNDLEINRYYLFIKKILKNNDSTLPTFIIYEKKINLFLRTHEYVVKKSIGMNFYSSSFQVFKKLRLIKNLY